MSNLEIGLASFPALLILIFIRVPIGLAMFLVGLVGLYFTTGSFNLPLARLKSETFSTFSSYSLSIVPMFLLMGHFATLGGMSSALFKAAESFLGHRKGGIAMAAIGACAGFGHGGDHGARCFAPIAQIWLFRRLFHRHFGRRRHPGDFDSALHCFGDLCDFNRAKYC